jgi:hypothetical protein
MQGHMKKLLSALALVVAFLGPISVSAAPSPSPALGTLLATPPAGYVAVSNGPFHGQFSAAGYASQYQSKTLEAGITLIHDGFVDGYGMTWVQRSTNRVLLEYVIAFDGGNGAKSWLGYEETSDHSDPNYKHSDSVSGIDPYYGVHFAFTSPRSYADAFSFVKGNDMFGVGFVSTKDDMLKLATSQTKSQYDSVPAETIPKAKWSENVHFSKGTINILFVVIGAVIVLVLIAGVARLVMSRLRGS